MIKPKTKAQEIYGNRLNVLMESHDVDSPQYAAQVKLTKAILVDLLLQNGPLEVVDLEDKALRFLVDSQLFHSAIAEMESEGVLADTTAPMPWIRTLFDTAELSYGGAIALNITGNIFRYHREG